MLAPVARPERRTIFPSMAGIKIVPMKALPINPWPALEARRMVRHQMKDVLDWLGEPVGEAPGDPVHMVWLDGKLMVSPEMFVLIVSGVVGEFVNGKKDDVV